MLNLDALAEVCRQYDARMLREEPLSAHTTFRVGGSCAAMITVTSERACRGIVQYLRLHQIPFRLIGRGSNLLVPDSGYAGVVLLLGGELAELTDAVGPHLVCGAGMSLKSLCMAALSQNLSGLEFAYGIPGTVGGAVYMNAGAYDGEMSQVVESVTVLDDTGAVRTLAAEALHLSYRHSIFMGKNWQILSVTMRLKPGEYDAIREKMQDLLGRRQSKQPLEYPSAGSTFKRPEGDYASRLIDVCGLKGYRVGGAQVSEKHAGFVVNLGGATFADIMAVCGHVQETVQEQTGYALELEPEILRAETPHLAAL